MYIIDKESKTVTFTNSLNQKWVVDYTDQSIAELKSWDDWFTTVAR